MEEKLNLVQEWDKTFPKSEKINHKKVIFHNRYGINLVADLYEPKDAKGKLPAIAVCGPFGAVKEQASGLYAQTMALYTFLDEYDLSGKTIAPFVTSGGSGLSGTPSKIEDEEPNATVTEGLSVRDSNSENSQSAVSEWLSEIGF